MIKVTLLCSSLLGPGSLSSALLSASLSDCVWWEVGEAVERRDGEGEREGDGGGGGSIISGASSSGGRARRGCLGMVGGGVVET